jgi:transcriptional regulator with XRE-family HTH domain
MAFKAQLQTGDGQRSDPRRSLRLDTSGRLGGGGEANVTVHNLSAAGLLLETAQELDVGEQLTIDLPEAGAVDAVIVWRSERLYGCAFETALSSAALAAAQLRAQPPVEPATPSPRPVREPFGPGIGAKLNRLRRERGLTLADVAGALGVSKPTVWAWEKGKARPLPDRIEAIAEALEVSPDELQEATVASSESQALIDECRTRIAGSFNIAPTAVRIMLEL